jgi:uncharacterized protein
MDDDANVVDSHVHLLPERLGAAIRAFFAEHGIDPARFAFPLAHDVICDRLAADGVAAAWTLPYVRRPGAATALNEATARIAAECTRRGPVEVIAGCSVHPADDDPLAEVRTAVEDLGARVLKLHCSVGDYSPDDRRFDPVWEWVSATRLPVVVHAGHGVTGHTGADELEPIAAVAQRWPDARVIVAHCGHAAADRTLELLRRHPNLHADLTPVVFELVEPEPGAVAGVADRLLFGSDAPNTAFEVSAALAAVDRLELPDHLHRAVTGGTARRLVADIAT